MSKDKKNHQKYGLWKHCTIMHYTIYKIEEFLKSILYRVAYLGFCLVGEGEGYDFIQ